MSSATSITSTSPPSPPTEKDDQRKVSEEEPFNPRSLKFITVMLGMYMSVFLVALVRSRWHSLQKTLVQLQDTI
jgi:hypothetical protein